MSKSLNIIQSIIDENLIDAKRETQGYLNDILTEALKEKFEEVAPTVIGEEKKSKKSKPHKCANHVEHAEWGEGMCISEHHANPDENGHVAWYDVQFEHGVEERVPTENLTILGEAMHEHAENPNDVDTIEEAKGSKDKDGDGDGDFADVMMSRMIASGMSKEEAMKKTRKHNKKG
jgi:hypothetical protein